MARLLLSAPAIPRIVTGPSCRSVPAATAPRSWVEIAAQHGVRPNELLRVNPGAASGRVPSEGVIYLPPCFRGKPSALTERMAE